MGTYGWRMPLYVYIVSYIYLGWKAQTWTEPSYRNWREIASIAQLVVFIYLLFREWNHRLYRLLWLTPIMISSRREPSACCPQKWVHTSLSNNHTPGRCVTAIHLLQQNKMSRFFRKKTKTAEWIFLPLGGTVKSLIRTLPSVPPGDDDGVMICS